MDARTKEILNRFDKSWTNTESFFDDLINNYPGFERLKPLRQFIAKLRLNGEDKYFRLSTFMHALSLSRSVDFGLRIDQKYIKIEAIDFNDFEVVMRDGEKVYREYRISDLDDIRLLKLLQTLKDTLID
jgi:hypothetical protein